MEQITKAQQQFKGVTSESVKLLLNFLHVKLHESPYSLVHIALLLGKLTLLAAVYLLQRELHSSLAHDAVWYQSVFQLSSMGQF